MNTIDTFDRNEVIKMAQECGLVIAEPANGALSEIWSGVSSLALEVLCNKAAELERARLMQIFTDPANQPSQFGTVALEYTQAEGGHCMCPACKNGVIHLSDCAVHNEPAMPVGPCDCKREEAQTAIDKFVSSQESAGLTSDQIDELVFGDAPAVENGAGYYEKGSDVINMNPTESCISWRCDESGIPGVWSSTPQDVRDKQDKMEAQTVEPFAWVVQYTNRGQQKRDVYFNLKDALEYKNHVGRLNMCVATCKTLFTHPAPPLSGERAALISAMHMYAAGHPDSTHFKRVAIMLAADAQEIAALRAQYANCTEAHDSTMARAMRAEDKLAQQVAVMQEKDKLCAGLTAGRVMQKAFAWCPTDHPHPWRMQWIADYFIANAPQPPQAERVPMTDEELESLWRTVVNLQNTHKEDAFCLARAIEAHHHIGVK